MLQKLKLPFKILVSISILWLLISKMNMSALETSFHDLKWSAWFWATLLVLLQITLISIRWATLVNVTKHKISLFESVRISALSSIANLLFITSVGGIVVRVALAMQHGLSLSKAVLATFIDRLFTLLGLLIITACLYSFLQPYVPSDIYTTTGFMLIGLIISGLMALPLIFKAPYNNQLFLNKKIAPIAVYARSILTVPVIMTKATFLSVAAQICFIMSCFVIILSTGANVPILATLALLPIIALVSTIPAGFGGWGIREGAFVFGLGFVGIPIEQAFLISVQIGVIGILAVIMLGSLVLLTSKDFQLEHFKTLVLKKKQPVSH